LVQNLPAYRCKTEKNKEIALVIVEHIYLHFKDGGLKSKCLQRFEFINNSENLTKIKVAIYSF
jgi:hypothetical protein